MAMYDPFKVFFSRLWGSRFHLILFKRIALKQFCKLRINFGLPLTYCCSVQRLLFTLKLRYSLKKTATTKCGKFSTPYRLFLQISKELHESRFRTRPRYWIYDCLTTKSIRYETTKVNIFRYLKKIYSLSKTVNYLQYQLQTALLDGSLLTRTFIATNLCIWISS